MKSWLTTHYPHPYKDDLPWHIYLQRDSKNAVDGISKGDQVFFYEYKYQKPLKDGTEYPLGKVGIVRVAFVSGQMYSHDGKTALVQYADGSIGDWHWGVPTDNPDVNGFVCRQEVLEILGYKPRGYLRGFNAGTGVIQLKNEQAEKLLKLFKQNK